MQAVRRCLSGRGIGPEGSFNFSSCFTHNYREFLGGFSDWVEQMAEAGTRSTIVGAS